MSGSVRCACPEPRDFEVVARFHNHSAFSGGRRTSSDYSNVRCRKCRRTFRTRAKYVLELPDAPDACCVATVSSSRDDIIDRGSGGE